MDAQNAPTISYEAHSALQRYAFAAGVVMAILGVVIAVMAAATIVESRVNSSAWGSAAMGVGLFVFGVCVAGRAS